MEISRIARMIRRGHRRPNGSYVQGAATGAITLVVNNTYGVVQGGTLRGIAPFPVHLDLADTTSTLTSNPFHDILFTTTFGETTGPGVADWAYGARSTSATKSNKNTEVGGIVGHIYETPGTYTITSTARWGATTATPVTYTVIVDDPNDSVNGYANVSCISTSASTVDDVAAQAGQTVTHITCTTWEQVIAHVASKIGAKWYFRLKKGDVFPFTSAATAASNNWPFGNFRMDSYGPASTNPTVATSFPSTNAATTYAPFYLGGPRSGTAGVPPLGNPGGTGMQRFSFQDIIIDHTAELSHRLLGFTNAGGGFRNACILRVQAKAVKIFFNCISQLDQWNADAAHKPGDAAKAGHIPLHGLIIQECSKTNNFIGTVLDSSTYPYGCYMEAEKFIIQGCLFDLESNTSREVSHGIRVAYGYKYALSHNYVAQSGSFQDSFKLHSSSLNASFPQAITTTNGSADIGFPSHKLVVGDVWAFNTQIAPATPFYYGAKVYYVVTVVNADTVQLSDTPGGVPIVATETTPNARIVAGNCTAGRLANWGTTTTANKTWRESFMGATSPGVLAAAGQAYPGIGGVSQYSYIGDNSGRGNASPEWLMVGTQQDGDSGNCYDVVVNGNWFQGNTTVNTSQLPFASEGVRVTFRNNLVDVAGAQDATGILTGNLRSASIDHALPVDTWIYCNTIRNTSATTQNDFQGVTIFTGSTGTIVKNNLAWDSVGSFAQMTGGTRGTPGSTDNGVGSSILSNSSDAQVRPTANGGTDPLFLGTVGTVDNWKVSSSSYAKNAGADVPVWDDFWGNTRPTGNKDIGAFEQ